MLGASGCAVFRVVDPLSSIMITLSTYLSEIVEAGKTTGSLCKRCHPGVVFAIPAIIVAVVPHVCNLGFGAALLDGGNF